MTTFATAAVGLLCLLLSGCREKVTVVHHYYMGCFQINKYSDGETFIFSADKQWALHFRSAEEAERVALRDHDKLCQNGVQTTTINQSTTGDCSGIIADAHGTVNVTCGGDDK